MEIVGAGIAFAVSSFVVDQAGPKLVSLFTGQESIDYDKETLDEQKRKDEADLKQKKEQNEYYKKRERITDFLNEIKQKQQQAKTLFNMGDITMKRQHTALLLQEEEQRNKLKELDLEYNENVNSDKVTGLNLNKSDKQEINEIIYITTGVGTIIGIIYFYKKSKKTQSN